MGQLSSKERSELDFWIDHVHWGGCERESGRPFLEQWREGARGRLKFYFENIEDKVSTENTIWVDVGCGPFSVLLEAPEGVTKVMVDPLMKHYVNNKLVPTVEDQSRRIFLEGSGENIPLVNETADLVFCTNTIDHVSDPWATLSELLRVTKVGGYLILDADMEGQTDEMHPHALKVADVEKYIEGLGATRTFSHFPQGVKRRPGAILYFGFFKKTKSAETSVSDTDSNQIPYGSYHPALIAENVKGFNIIKLSALQQDDKYFAILQTDGPFSYEKVINTEYTVVIDGKSVGEVKQAIKNYVDKTCSTKASVKANPS